MPIILEINSSQFIKPLKSYLESINAIHKHKKIIKLDDTRFHIFTTLTSIEGVPSDLHATISSIVEYEDENNEEDQNSNKLAIVIQEYLTQILSISDSELKILIENIPKKWSVYPPMILFNYNSFDNTIWHDIDFNNLFEYIISKNVFPDITHFAINQPIIKTNNEMRKPINLIPLYGDFGSEVHETMNPTEDDFKQSFWCSVIQNGIYQTWCPKYTMFSRGNIKEKARILQTYKSLHRSVVFDLYCGIGYFSLSYLRNDAVVFCWDLNPWSIEGFRRALIKNKFPHKIFHPDDDFNYEIYQQCLSDGIRAFVFLESNEMSLTRLESFPSNSLDIKHVNLGLLPTSYQSWTITKSITEKYNAVNNKKNTLIHIHENYHIKELPNLIQFIKSEFSISDKDNDDQILGINKIKSYAPDIWHVVVDIKI
ncbi:S-adenosyl-L-methionine-dependent methyltransferase [Scheffersomyces coipomensis]|uniref:S-adenosyl-L-methionine-dependent methyltransferase n=1 Tax=Scheffersomyces coipomensis TaxID=1788519 RepID=UPI00315CAEAC